MSEQRPILYCRCAFAKVLPEEVKDGVLQRLVASDFPFDSVPDLCEMSAKNDPSLKEIAAQENVCIVACYPRAVRWLFDAAGAPIDPQRVKVLNMRTESVDKVWEDILAVRSNDSGAIGSGPGTPEAGESDSSGPTSVATNEGESNTARNER